MAENRTVVRSAAHHFVIDGQTASQNLFNQLGNFCHFNVWACVWDEVEKGLTSVVSIPRDPSEQCKIQTAAVRSLIFFHLSRFVSALLRRVWREFIESTCDLNAVCLPSSSIRFYRNRNTPDWHAQSWEGKKYYKNWWSLQTHAQVREHRRSYTLTETKPQNWACILDWVFFFFYFASQLSEIYFNLILFTFISIAFIILLATSTI